MVVVAVDLLLLIFCCFTVAVVRKDSKNKRKTNHCNIELRAASLVPKPSLFFVFCAKKRFSPEKG